MRRMIVVFALLTLACGGGAAGGADDYRVPLTEPWTAMKLPIGEGLVKFADPTSASVEYGERPIADIAKDYIEAVKAAGWSETAASEAGGMFNATYARAGKTLTLSVISANDATTVSLVES